MPERAIFRGALFSIFVNKAVDRVTNRVIRTPDPTAIEFQETYQRIMATVSAVDRRFVFVIDNLDRIPELEAVALWSTIRSFFLSRTNEVIPGQQEFPPPVVILPLDPNTVRRMYGSDHDDGQELAQAFLDKTFDLIFRVAPPVLSDWQSYFSTKLQEAFGKSITDQDIYAITKLYAAFLIYSTKPDGPAQSVTPRNIIKLVNLIVTLVLQHGVEIPIATIAYYAIHKSRIENNIQAILHSDDHNISRFENDWRTYIALLYYGVPKDKALQVLMQPALQSSLVQGEYETFSKLTKVPGFDVVLEQIIEEVNKPTDPEFITNAAQLLERTKVPLSPRIAAVQRNLVEALNNVTEWRSIGTNTSTGVQWLLESVPADRVKHVAQSLATSMARVTTEFAGNITNAENWILVAETVQRVSDARDAPLGEIVVPGEPQFFLAALLAARDRPDLVSLLRPSQGLPPTIQAIANAATTVKFANDIENTVKLLISNKSSWPWDVLIAAAGQYIQQQAAENIGTAAALRLLGILRGNGAAKELRRLSSENCLFDKLSQAHANNFSDAEASIISALILTNPTFTKGPTAVGDSEAGYQLAVELPKTLSNRADIITAIDRQLAEYGTFKEAVDAAESNSAIRPIVAQIFSARVNEDRIGRLHVDDIIERLPIYLGLLNGEERNLFLQALANYETFWKRIESAPVDEKVVTIFDSLIELDDERGEKARSLFERRAKKLTTEAWITILETGTRERRVIAKLVRHTDKLDFGEGLSQALHSLVYKALDGTAFDPDIFEDWFKLAGAIDAHAREVLFKDVRDRMIAIGSIRILPILAAGKGALLEEGQFSAKPDEAVRLIVNPLLEQSEGISWLVQNELPLVDWIAQADEGTRRYTADRLFDLTRSDESAKAEAASRLISIWQLDSLLQKNPAISDENSLENEGPKEIENSDKSDDGQPITP